MKKTAIIYSFNTNKSAKIAELIKKELNDEAVEMVNAEDLSEKQFLSYDQLILGVPTWFDGELPNYWDEFIPALEDMDLKNKLVALYGLGDQKGYPENFVDGMGILGEILESLGAKIVGHTSSSAYNFESSKALKNGNFIGLAIDYENQGSKNKSRITAWVKLLNKAFK